MYARGLEVKFSDSNFVGSDVQTIPRLTTGECRFCI